MTLTVAVPELLPSEDTRPVLDTEIRASGSSVSASKTALLVMSRTEPSAKDTCTVSCFEVGSPLIVADWSVALSASLVLLGLTWIPVAGGSFTPHWPEPLAMLIPPGAHAAWACAEPSPAVLNLPPPVLVNTLTFELENVRPARPVMFIDAPSLNVAITCAWHSWFTLFMNAFMSIFAVTLPRFALGSTGSTESIFSWQGMTTDRIGLTSTSVADTPRSNVPISLPLAPSTVTV